MGTHIFGGKSGVSPRGLIPAWAQEVYRLREEIDGDTTVCGGSKSLEVVCPCVVPFVPVLYLHAVDLWFPPTFSPKEAASPRRIATAHWGLNTNEINGDTAFCWPAKIKNGVSPCV